MGGGGGQRRELVIIVIIHVATMLVIKFKSPFKHNVKQRLIENKIFMSHQAVL